jgi:hypothetical protein
MEGGAAARVASLLTIHNIFPVLKRKFLLDYSSAGGAALFDQLGGAGAKQWKPGGPWAHRCSCAAGHALSFGDAVNYDRRPLAAVKAELSCHFFADADVPRLTNSLFLAPGTLLVVLGKLRSAFPG